MSFPEGTTDYNDHVVSSLDAVRRHPGWYFRSGEFDADEAIALLGVEALRCGARTVERGRSLDWWWIISDLDWMGGDLAGFFAPISYPEGGPNSSFAAVVLTAFCPAVATAADGQQPNLIVSPSVHLPDRERILSAELPIGGRVIAFVPPSRQRAADMASSTDTRQPPGLRLLQGGVGEREIASAVESLMRKHDRV